jgi:hypothetical protein
MQDLNRVTQQLYLSQPCTKVLVGDRHQHIYSFNYCCNIMGEPMGPGDRNYTLTASFRLGPEIAAAANRYAQSQPFQLIISKRKTSNT